MEIIATKILLSQYALVKNLGVEVIEMKDRAGNPIFVAKDGDVTCMGGNFQNVNVSGNFTSRDATTWNEVEINAKQGGLTMRGPSNVSDDDHNLPSSPNTEVIDLFKIYFETDPDSLSRITILKLLSGLNSCQLTFDAERGISMTGRQDDNLNIMPEGIRYEDWKGNIYYKSWSDLLK